MGTKTFSKKLIAFVSAVVMSASLAAYVPSGVLQKFDLGNANLTSYAWGEGQTATSGGSGGSGYEDVPPGAICVNTLKGGHGSTGVRIYLTQQSVYVGEGKVTNKSVSCLDYGKQYSLYCLSDGAYCKNITKDNSLAIGYGFNDEKVSRSRILSAGSTFNFAQLFNGVPGGVSTATMWGYSSVGGVYNLSADRPITSISDWANNEFSAKMNENDDNVSWDVTERLDKFISNFSSYFTNTDYKAKQFPTNASDYLAGNWSIVVEPIVVLGTQGDGSTYHFVSLNDFYHPQDYKDYPNSDVGVYSGRRGTGNSYKASNTPVGTASFVSSYNSVGGKSAAICTGLIDGCLGTMYMDFDSKITGTHISTKSNNDKHSLGWVLRGFGVYAQNETMSGAKTVRINKNISLFSNNIKPSGTSKMSTRVSGNENKGNVVLAEYKKDKPVTSVSGKNNSELLQSLHGLDWYTGNANKGNLMFYKTGADLGEFKFASKDAKTFPAENPDSMYTRLVGYSHKELDKSGYIMTELYLGEYSANTSESKIASLFSIFTNSFAMSSCIANPVTKFVNTNNKNEGTYSFGNNYSAKLTYTDTKKHTVGDLSDAAKSVADSFHAGVKGSGAIITSLYHHFGTTWDMSNTKSSIANSVTYALNNSKVSIKKGRNGAADTYGKKSNDTSKIGVTIQALVPDQKVTSYKQTIHRDKDGKVTYSKPEEIGTYSIYNEGVRVEVPFVQTAQSEFCVVVPNTKASGDLTLASTYTGSANDTKSGRRFGEAVFGTSAPYNTANGLARLSGMVRTIFAGVVTNTSDLSGAVVPVAAFGQTSLSLRAYSDIDNEAGTNQYCGYTVYIIEDDMVQANQNVEMTLASHNLNYVYPSLLGDSKGHFIRTLKASDTNGMTYFEISKTNDYKGTLIDNEKATKGITLLYGQYDLPYGSKTYPQIFALEATNPKVFRGVTESVTLNHAVSMTRGSFGDKYVVSSFSKSNTNFANTSFYTDVLKMSFGNVGSTAPKNINSGKTGVFANGYDQFRWACNRAALVLNHTRDGGATYSEITPFTSGESQKDAGYNISETINRYVTVDKPTASNATSGMISTGRVKATNSAYGYRAYSVKSYDKTFKFYPEVAMSAWKYDDSTGVIKSYSDVTHGTVYVLGEKVRSLKATAMYGIAVNGAANGKNLAGATKSDTVAAGSDAKALSKKFNNLQVIYAGGNVNVAASGNFSIDLSGFALDQIDKDKDKKLVTSNGNGVYTDVVSDNSNLKKTWGSDAYDAQSEYQKWVEEVKNSLAVDMSLQVSKDLNGGNVVKTYNGYKASVGKVDGGNIESTTSYALTYKNGVVVEDTAYAELIKALRQYAGVSSDAEAKALFEASGINKEILSSIESSTNGSSEKVDGFAGDHWYDETVRTFVVRYYKCAPIKMSNITVSDKIDINAGPSQSTKSKTLFSNGYVGKWYLTVYLKSANSSMPSLTLYDAKKQNYDADSVLIAKQHVEQADFVIPDATTADARK